MALNFLYGEQQNNIPKRKQVVNNILLGKISMNRKEREGILKYSKKFIVSLDIVRDKIIKKYIN